MPKKRILVVDYEPKSLERLLELIPSDKYEIATARDGMAAIEEFGRFNPDLVFLRTMLPKKHGFQVCQEMVGKGGTRPVPVIMHCSIYKSRKYKTDAIKIYGATDYLEDPIEPATIGELLDKFLEVKEKSPPPKAKEPSAMPDISIPEIPKAAPARKKAAGFDVDKALEDTLSGVHSGLSKKPKPKPAEIPEPEPPVEKAAEPEPPPKSIEDDTQAPVSSEELFGDVLQEVERDESAPPPPEPEPGPPEVEEPPAPEPPPEPVPEPPEVETPPSPEPEPEPEVEEKPVAEEAPEEAAPPPVKPSPSKVAQKSQDLGSDLLAASKEDTGIRKAKAKSLGVDLDKELEDTLSGVKKKKKIKPPKAAPAEEPEETPPPPPPVEEKPREKPAPEPAPEPPKAAAEVPAEPEAERKAEVVPSEEGITYGKYLLVDKVAVGGMAELFMAKQKGPEDFQRIVAIKRILPHLAANQEFVTMFIDEAKLAAQLNHPNIGHIYDLGKIDDTYFIAMEYIEGKDLRSILRELYDRKMRLPLKLAVFIAQRLCSALHYAHTAKDADRRPMDLVHRDISPQNILISITGEVKLVDFGIAKAATKASHTQSGALKGKLLYMSPEQAWGKKIDSRTDIFSLGTVLYEMLTGKKLFSGDSEMSILEKVRTATVSSPREAREDLPEPLERIILKALKKDPSQRYQDCRGMQQALEQFCYREWNSLPSSHEVALYLHDIFPEVYTKEALKELQEEGEAGPETVKMKAKPELAEEKPSKPPEPKAPPPPEKPKEEKPPRPEPPPKPPIEEKKEKTSPMFTDLSEDEGAGKKKIMMIGIAAAVVLVIAVILAAVFMGGKGEEKTLPVPPPDQAVDQQPAEEEPPETIPEEEPVEEETAPTDEAPTQAQIDAARGRAQTALDQFNAAVTRAEQAQAAQYATEAFNLIRDRQQNLTTLMSRAETPGDFQSIVNSARQGAQRAGQIQAEAEQAKAAADEEARRLAEEAEEARRRAEEERKRQEEAAAQEQPEAKPALKPGDFVEAWALDVKPKPNKDIRVEYTPLARSNRIEGTVYYEVSIDERGNVSDVKIVKGFDNDCGMHQAIIDAAKGTKFSPGIKGGVPVKTKMTYPINFRMR